VLEAGRETPAAADLARLVAACRNGEAAFVGADRNAVCHRGSLCDAHGVPREVVIKMARAWPARTNPDPTFGAEARNLLALEARAIAAVPRLVARVHTGGIHVLVASWTPGDHPDVDRNPLTSHQMRRLLDWCLAAEREGFLHYDLKPRNVLTDEDSVAVIDVEFGRFEAGDAFAADDAWLDDYNVATNPHLPRRSNVANFEFRTLDRLCGALERAGRDAAASRLVDAWLRAKAAYHHRLNAHLIWHRRRSSRPEGWPDREPPSALADCREGARAARHERLLADLYAVPGGRIVAIERALMRSRARVFEPAGEEGLEAVEIAQRTLARTAGVPQAYRDDVARVLARLARCAARTAANTVARAGHPCTASALQTSRSTPIIAGSFPTD
jgi:hypothetical protein